MGYRPGWMGMLAACGVLLAGALAQGLAAEQSTRPGKTPGVETALDAVSGYSFGDSREPVRTLMKLAHESAGDEDLRSELAGRMADMLDGPATTDAKKVLCDALGVAGTAEQVPALAKLLDHQDLSFHARAALARMPGDEVDSALRDTLENASGGAAAGLISTLGRRGDARAVELISRHLHSDDTAVAQAAIRALGRIGSQAALAELREAAPELPGELSAELAHALLLHAERLQNAGKTRQAASLYEDLRGPAGPVSVRAAAVEGLLASTGQNPAELLRGALQEDPHLRDALLHRLDRMVSNDILRELVESLSNLAPPVQVTLIRAVARRRLDGAEEALSAAVESSHEAVHTAAMEALGRAGDASTVPLLVSHLDRQVARRSLVRLRGDGVNKAIIDALEDATPSAQRHLIQVLVERSAASAVPSLVRLAEDGKQRTRMAALRALGELADSDHLSALIELLKGMDADLRSMAEAALMRTARRIEDRTQAVKTVRGALPDDRGTPLYRSLLRVLGALGGPQALKVVRGALESGPGQTAETALRVLADWPDGAALPVLLGVARGADEPRRRTVALRGFAQVAPRDDERDAAELADMFGSAFEMAETAGERKALLGALPSAPSPRSLEFAEKLLSQKAVEKEAALAVLQLSETLGADHRAPVVSALRRVIGIAGAAGTVSRALSALEDLSELRNLAADATASSPDDLEKDGSAGGDGAGIDGDESTYWDEEDGHDLYRYRVTFPEPRTVSVITLRGYQHQNYAPRDFEVLCDGEVVKEVRGASYDDNLLVLRFESTRCESLELKITGYYGQSPAIRELGIYHPGAGDGSMSRRPEPPHYAATRISLVPEVK